MPLTDKDILNYISANPGAGRASVRRDIAPEFSPATIWRALKRLVDEGRLEVSGKAQAAGYSLAGSAAVRIHLQTPHNRRRLAAYSKDFLDRYIPNKTFYLSQADRQQLQSAGRPVPMSLPAGTYARRILERLLVDLSWASSRMEGNTYSILETERLIRFGELASGKDRAEAVMILNHKEAIQHVVDHLSEISICRRDLFDVHALLANGLLADPAMAGRLRRTPVGITRSSYWPLDDPIEIDEEFRILVEKAASIADPFEQSFFLLVHIPYLQAFYDINKRTSRIASNIPLLKADLAPMSFLAMDDRAYIDGLIGIYEINNASLLREVYVDAYLASAVNYSVLRAEVHSPEKATLAYRDFLREAIRRCTLEWKSFRAGEIRVEAAEAGIPESDLEGVVDYVGKEFRGLHEGNVVRYGLRPEDLEGIGED